jgi:hypothetical protein
MYEEKKWYFYVIQIKLISITNLGSEFETNDLMHSSELYCRSLNGNGEAAFVHETRTLLK